MMINLNNLLTIIFIIFAICLQRSSSLTCDNGDVTKLASWQQELMVPDRNMGAICFETTYVTISSS